MRNIFDYSLPALEQELAGLGEKPYRARQIFEWVYQKYVLDFRAMTNISRTSQEILASHFEFSLPELVLKQTSRDGTVKFLLKLADGHLIESVYMPQHYGESVCISSQVGCNLACRFCASGLIKADRNLTTGEMVGQVLLVSMALAPRRLSHVVVMGIGEPFLNYENLLEALAIINHDKGLAIGARHLTVSTSGIAPKIRAFADFPLQVNLAVSLHFVDQAQRAAYMPIGKIYPLTEVFAALRYYYGKTHRRITFEYLLIKDVNDSPETADKLADLVRGLNCYINLIPVNENPAGLARPSEAAIKAFHARLMERKIQATIRKEYGADIDAACGQLRSKRR